MGKINLRRGVQRGTFEVPGGGADAISLCISEPPNTFLRWKISVDVQSADGKQMFAARMLTAIAGPNGIPPDRVIAVLCIPGARRWFLQAEPFIPNGNAKEPAGYLWAEGCRAPTAGGVSLLNGTRLRRPHYLTGAGPGTATIPPNVRVAGWTATAGGGAGTMTLTDDFGAQPAITIPTGLSIGAAEDEEAPIDGPATMVFGGSIAAYTVLLADPNF